MSRSPLDRDAPDDAQFATHTILDEPHQRMIVATFEYPQDWTAFSQVFWNFKDVGFPMKTHAAVFNPNGTEAFEFLPIEAFFWVTPNFMYSPGQSSNGQICMPPMRALDALLQYTIPKYRGDRQNLHIIHAEVVPNLAQTLNATEVLNAQNEGVRARIGYVENGQMFEEEFYACGYWLPPNGAQTNWGLARLSCFRAAPGQLDAARQTFWHILTSLQNNPEWGRLSMQVCEQLMSGFRQFHDDVRARIQAETKWGEQMAAYRQGQRDQQQQRLDGLFAADERKRQQQQEAYGSQGIAEDRGDLLRGRTAYHDPNSEYGNPYHDYGHHQQVWTDGKGGWIPSNNASYDPNSDPDVSSNGHWTLAKKL